MAENVGRVDVTVDLDAKTFDAQVKAIGEAAGRAMARSFSRSFNQQMKQLTREMQGGMRGVRSEVEKTTKAINDQSHAWRRLPHGFRQFTFYTALFANLGQSISVLGSAVGSGVTVLTGALSSLIVGGGVLAAVFKNLNDEIEDLPVEIRGAARAFQGIGDEFSILQKRLQARGLKNAEEDFDSLRDTVAQLAPALEEVADHVGNLIKSFARGLAPGTRNFQNLNKFVKASGPLFEKLVKSIGKFGEGLLEAFANDVMIESIDKLFDWIDDLAEKFLKFTQSSALETWLRNGQVIFGAFGRLLEATGTMLSNLVTPAAVQNLVDFFDNLTEFMPNLGQFLDILGRLDIFGLIAQGLNDFAKALEPLAVPLGELFDALNRIVSITIDQWAEDLAPVFEALAPFVQGLADAFSAMDEQQIREIADGLLILASGLLAVKAASAGVALISTLAASMKSLSGAKVSWKTILSGLTAGALAAFIGEMFSAEAETMGDVWSNVLGGAIAGGVFGIIGGPWGVVIGSAVGAVIAWFIDLFKNPALFEQTMIDLATAAGEWLLGITTAVQAWFLTIAVELANGFANIGATTTAGFLTIGVIVATWLSDIWTNITTWFMQVQTGWNAFWISLGVILTNAWLFIVNWISTQITNIRTNIENGLRTIGTNWNNFWAGIGSFFTGLWNNIVTTVRNAVNTVIDIINGLIAPINRALDGIKSITGGLVNLKIPSLKPFAKGGMVFGPTRALIGERGPEMVVPLSQPLSQVDPAVRSVAAFAQGRSPGVGTTPGKITNVEEGAIVVHTVAPPLQVANAILDRLVANAMV